MFEPEDYENEFKATTYWPLSYVESLIQSLDWKQLPYEEALDYTKENNK